MTKDEAMKLALEALEGASRYGAGGFDDAKDALRVALAKQPAQQEPVLQEPVYLVWMKAHCAWMHTDKEGFDKTSNDERWMLYEPPSTKQDHADDQAVERFAAAMKDKLAKAREKGRTGWGTCPPADLSRMLCEHVEKGDPRDVANFCMMLWNLGEGITAQQEWRWLCEDRSIGAGKVWQSRGLPSVLAEQPAQQAPVAVQIEGELYFPQEIDWEELAKEGHKVLPFYTSPPQRTWVGLTDEDINDLVKEFDGLPITLSYAIEAKLKEKNT